MFNKNDPLIDSVSKIMKENQIRRDVEQSLNEELGIFSKKELPYSEQAKYDAVLEEAIQEALKGNQHKIDANKNNRIDSHDFKLLRAKKEKKPEEHGVEAEREMASKGQKVYEEEQLDEAGTDTIRSYLAKNKKQRQTTNMPIRKASKRADSYDLAMDKLTGQGKAKILTKEEERGKKVAGAVLAKLRAKSMKEESEESDPAVSNIQEKAPPGAKFERMVKHIKDKYKEGGLTKKEKSIAYATAWKAKNKEDMSEETDIDSIMEEIAHNLNEKAYAMLQAPFHEAAAWFNSLDEEQLAMLDDTILEAAGTVGPAVVNANKQAAAQQGDSTPQYGGGQMGSTPSAVKSQTTQTTGTPLAVTPPTSYSGSQGAAETAARMKVPSTAPAPMSMPNVRPTATPAPAITPRSEVPSATTSKSTYKPVTDTDVMNDPRFKQGLKAVGGPEGAKRLQGGTNVPGVGKVAQGSNIMNTVKQQIAAERGASVKVRGGSARE